MNHVPVPPTGTLFVTGFVNATSICVTNYNISAMDISYSAASFSFDAPSLGFTSNVNNLNGGKLIHKLPTASSKIQSKIKAAVAAAVPTLCKNPTNSSVFQV